MNTMHKDEVMDLANNLGTMPLDKMLEQYRKFLGIVTNTPIMVVEKDVPAGVYSVAWTEGLHAAIGMATEAAEILDAYKKDMFGKRKPLARHNMVEEAGDMFFYLTNHMLAHDISFEDLIRDNLTKLVNRYIEKFEVS